MIETKENSDTRLKLLEFTFNDNQDDSVMTDFAESFNIFPLVIINNELSGNTISPELITYVKLFNNKFLPEIEMLCTDNAGVLMDGLFPFDGDIILSIFVKSTIEDTYPIRMDFRILEFNPIQTDVIEGEKTFLIKGILDVAKLHYTEFEAFNKSTSFNVLQNLSKRIGLGFASNIDNTDDNMTWINPAITNLEFIQHVTKRAYISDETFVWSFIDFYYNLNFVDIEKELGDNPTELQSLSTSFNDGEERLVEQYLSMSKNLSSINKFIKQYNINNRSFKANLESGYRYSSRWFNKSENTIEHVITRENETNNQNLTQLITDDEISDRNWDGTFIGKIDTDNVHQNYHIALTLNSFNIEKLHKLTMTVSLPLVNFEVKRFQNILVDVVDIDINNDSSGIKEKLSGYWFVTGINYTFKSNSGAVQEITMVRRDLNKSYKNLHDIRKPINEKNK